MRIVNWCLGALFISMWSASAQTIEVPLKVQEGANYPCMSQIKLSPAPPEGTWKLPDLTGRRARYGFVVMSDKKRLVIHAQPKAQASAGAAQIYLDENGDGDLTNELPFNVGTLGVFDDASTVKIKINGKSLSYSFNQNQGFTLKTDNQSVQDADLFICVQYFFEGQFTFDGQAYRVMLDDMNANGSLTDTIEPGEMKPTGRAKLRDAYRGDTLLLSPQGADGGYYDYCVLGKWISIKQQFFAIQVDDASQKIILTPTTDNVVSVKLPYETDRLWLVSEDGRESISYLSPGNSITVPKGKYRVMDYTISKKDEQGDLWTVGGSATANTPAFSAETLDTLCQFGEPYTPTTELIQPPNSLLPQAGNSNLQLQLYVVGTNQEVLRDIRHVSGTKTKIAMSTKAGLPKEPTYKIVKADGELAAQGNFEYG